MRISRNVLLSSCLVYLSAAVVSVTALFGATSAQSMPNPTTVVKPSTFVSFDPVAPGKTFEAAVVVEVQPGYHMNSHNPSADYLIPTTLTANPPAGIKVVDTLYPSGQMKTFSFSKDKPLSVYTGTVTLRLKLAVDQSAPPGPATIPAILRYQACNDTTCLPPVKVPVSLSTEIARAGVAGQAVHPEIFSPSATQ